MKINKNFKIWEAAEKTDMARPTMEYIHFINGYAYVSDSHILAKIDIRALFEFEPYEDAEEVVEALNGNSIHAAIWKKLTAYQNITIGVVGTMPQFVIDFSGQQILIPLRNTNDIKAPNFEAVITSSASEEPIRKIGINSALMNRLSRALGTDSIKLEFTNASSKVMARPMAPDYDVVGLIMPKVLTD